jgi:hypothetical protein
MNIPIVDKVDMKTLPKGIYVELYHGRDNADDEMEDWGFNGPVIGPLEHVHVTYHSHIRLGFVHEHDELRYRAAGVIGNEPFDLSWFEDMIMSGGKFYGDWSVIYNEEGL